MVQDLCREIHEAACEQHVECPSYYSVTWAEESLDAEPFLFCADIDVAETSLAALLSLLHVASIMKALLKFIATLLSRFSVVQLHYGKTILLTRPL